MVAIEELRHILLSEDRSTIDTRFDSFKQELLTQLDKVEKEIVDPEHFKVHLNKNKENLVDVMSPMLGMMIKKYVEVEINKINKRISSSTSKIKSSWKNLFSFGSKKQERKLSKIGFPEIMEILLIEKSSGILLGKFSREEKLDADIIAGMFSAIKSFAESAFEVSDNDLELIHYNDYKIKIQGFGTVYFAIVFRGRMDEAFDEILTEDVNKFIDKYYEQYMLSNNRSSLTKEISDLMNIEFKKTCKSIDQKLF